MIFWKNWESKQLDLILLHLLLNVQVLLALKKLNGPLSKYFDQTLDDEFWGEKTWEKAESKIIKETVNTVINKSGIPADEIDCMFAGDLLNQCISSSFGLRELSIPFFGVFGACSTFVESLSLGAIAVEGFAENVLCATSSHFCSAEKQFRFPLELGNQRPPTSQWTVTGSGAAIVSKNGQGPYITHITPGKIVDMGIKDANNMGAAMAPAAADTLIKHLSLKNATWPDERCASMRFIGRCYKNIKRYDEAIMWYEKAIREAPYLRDPYVELALLYYEKENYEKVYYYLKLALKIKTHKKTYINELFSWNETIYDLLGIAAYYLNLLPESLYYIDKALEINPDNKRIKNNKELIEKILNN